MAVGEKAELNRLEDQADWERCNSYQRMFLALHDQGRNMERVAEALLVIAVRYRPRSERTRRATQSFYDELDEDLHARPVYTVFALVATAIDERVRPRAPAGGGASVICQAIRREFPLAPSDFRKVGKQTGGPDQQGAGAATFPVRLLSLLRDR